MNFLRKLWRTAVGFFSNSKPYQTVSVEELPDKLGKRDIYLIGEDGDYWFAALKCPCGCNETIQLSLLPDDRPHWRYQRHNDNTLSLAPSVWGTKGCKSHFFVRRGEINWCPSATATELEVPS